MAKKTYTVAIQPQKPTTKLCSAPCSGRSCCKWRRTKVSGKHDCVHHSSRDHNRRSKSNLLHK